MHTCMHACMHAAYMHMYVHTYIRTYMHMCMYAESRPTYIPNLVNNSRISYSIPQSNLTTQRSMQECIERRAHAATSQRQRSDWSKFKCMSLYVCVCVCVCVCVDTYANPLFVFTFLCECTHECSGY